MVVVGMFAKRMGHPSPPGVFVRRLRGLNASLSQMAIEEEHAVETFKSIITVSLEGLKLLALFNGGAAVALLAYLGNVASKNVPPPDMRIPMLCYVAGLSACGLAFLFSYFTQLMLYNESIGLIPSGRHERVRRFAIGFTILSLVAFATGSCLAAWRFR